MVTYSNMSRPRLWPSQKQHGFKEEENWFSMSGGAVNVWPPPPHQIPWENMEFRVVVSRGGNVSAKPIEPAETSIASVYKEATEQNPHIELKLSVLDGKPCVKGTRIPVALVLRYLAVDDDPTEDLDITKKDVSDCLQFAATVCDQPLRSNAD